MPVVRLSMIFGSRLARGGCAAVLSAGAVPELSVGMAQPIWQRAPGLGAVHFLNFVQHYLVGSLLGVTRCWSQKHADGTLAVYGPRRKLWLRMVSAKRRRGYGKAFALAVGKAGGSGEDFGLRTAWGVQLVAHPRLHSGPAPFSTARRRTRESRSYRARRRSVTRSVATLEKTTRGQ
jgi:hypothetical protein